MAGTQHKLTLDEDPDHVDDSELNIKTEADKFGKTMRFMMFEGRHYCPFYHPRILEKIKDVQMRPDDIYLPVFPRTGTHWTFEMVSMLLNGKAETILHSKAKNQLEFMTNETLALIPSPRLLHSHMRISDGPRDVKEKKCKIIYNIRDPKDVAVSLYIAYLDLKVSECKCSFEGFFYLYLEGKVEADGIFGHWMDAEHFLKENPNIPVYYQIYEEVHKDPVLAVKNLSDFLGLPRNEELCRAIAEKCHMDNMRVDKDKYSIKVDGENSLYRKGIVGDWKNWFTDQMLEDYYRVYEEKMAGSRFYERYARQT